jgi:hypothetical protein
VTATTPSHYWIPVTKSNLSSGEHLAKTFKCFLTSLNAFILATTSTAPPPSLSDYMTLLRPPTFSLKSLPVMQAYYDCWF